nr:3D domain-containing protein [Lysinibacillus timonensis]
MFKKMISIVPIAVLSLSVVANAQAATVTVQNGDTLWDLAYENNTTVETIQTKNNMTTDIIHPGDVIAIAQEKQYTVKKGDTLWSIAKAHEVTVSQIKNWNQLKSDLIKPGLKLSLSEDTNSNGASSIKKTTTEVKEQKASTTKAKTSATKKEASKEITVEASAYTAQCKGCSGITSTGINLKKNPDAKVISVDPNVIPLGTKVYIEGYGEAIAGDTGSNIKGNRIDLFFSSKKEALNFGVQKIKVKILN